MLTPCIRAKMAEPPSTPMTENVMSSHQLLRRLDLHSQAPARARHLRRDRGGETKAIGARVIATAGAGDHDFVRSVGAEAAIDITSTDYVDAVAEMTLGKGVDVGLDTGTGRSPWSAPSGEGGTTLRGDTSLQGTL